MSKSKGNFFTLDDLLAKGYSARSIRYLLLSSHYRQTLNFTMRGLDSAAAALDRLDSFADTLSRYSGQEKGIRSNPAAMARKGFVAALNDDLNISNALATLFDYVREANERMAKNELTANERSDAGQLIKDVGQLLGFTFGRTVGDEDIPSSVKALVEKREQARLEKAFAEADRIRLELLEKGYEIEDTSDGPIIKRK